MAALLELTRPIWPSNRRTMRPGLLAPARSWVTITMVVPSRWLSSSACAMISSPIWLSRLPVGSSASSICGWPTIARAIATRCCWPPESWVGKWSMRERQADLFERRRARPCAARCRHLAIQQRHLDVVDAREVGDQVEALEDEADPLLRSAPRRGRCSGRPACRRARPAPRVGASSSPIRLSSVLLPQPEGP